MRFVLGKDYFRIVMSSAGVPMMATRGHCIILDTWLLLCLCCSMCFLLSIVCPLPSCHITIVSVAPVSLVTPPRLSPYLFSRCLQSCADPLCRVCYVCLYCSSLPACFSALGCFLFYFIIKRETILPAA